MANAQITQTVLGDHNIFTGIGDINVVYQLPPVEAEDRRNLLILLNKVKQFWIEGVLEQSVYHEALIQLGRESRPEMVEHPWGRVLELPDQAIHLTPDKKIGEIFDEVGRTLLILGEPGSGKTITMLELARVLLKKAENDPMQPIPVVLNLSTWTIKNPSIFDWLVGELSSKYQIPKRFGRPWLENNRLLLLLDGLDEVNANHRSNCVKAINEFVEQSGIPGLAVCSRLEEYLALPIYLKLSGAICLKPLSPDQIYGYLERAGTPLAALRTLLPTDPVLQDLAQTPLMLNVMSLAYQDLPLEALAKGEPVTVEERRKNLFDTYIKRMFERRGKADKPYSDDQTGDWLSWLAQRMALNSKTLFLLEELQPSWLPTHGQLWLYGLSSRLIFGLIYGMLYGLNQGQFGLQKLLLGLNDGLSIGLSIGIIACLLFIMTNSLAGRSKNGKTIKTLDWLCTGILKRSMWLTNIGISYGLSIGLSIFLIIGLKKGLKEGLILGLTAGIFFGLIAGLTSREERSTNDIQTTEALSWSWAGFRKGSRYGLTAGLIVGMIVGLSEWLSTQSIVRPIVIILVFVLLLWYLGSMLGGIKSRIIEAKSIPNQGISRSKRNAVIGGLFSGFIVGLLILPLWMR